MARHEAAVANEACRTPNDLSPDTVRLALNGDPDLMAGAAPLYGPKSS